MLQLSNILAVHSESFTFVYFVTGNVLRYATSFVQLACCNRTTLHTLSFELGYAVTAYPSLAVESETSMAMN